MAPSELLSSVCIDMLESKAALIMPMVAPQHGDINPYICKTVLTSLHHPQ